MKTNNSEMKKAAAALADELSEKSLAAARASQNRFWKLLLYGIGVVMAGIAALAGFTGCQSLPSVTLTVEQLQLAEEVYTAAGGEVKYRIVPVVDIKK